jgi:prepilin-type N-terminal cleavage/methylation domain-containing protein
MASSKQRGFSMLELVITITLSLIIGGITYISLRTALNQSHITEAYDTTLMVLRNTRNMAIAQGHEYVVTFLPATATAPATIEVQYQPGPVGGVAQPIQAVMNYTIPIDVNFAVQTGFPTNAPDGFGTGVTAIDFGQSLAGEPMNDVVFMPDGSSQASVVGSNGSYNSGVVYLTQASRGLYASRAITVWGATGRICGWTLTAQSGVATWEQQ